MDTTKWRAARRLRPGWNTPFGKNPITLLAFALTAIWRGQNYLTDGIPAGSVPPVEKVSGFIPLHVWPIIWLAAGIVMLVGLVWRRVFAAGASFVAVLWTLWGIAFLWAASAPIEVSSGAEVTGAGFLALGLAVWTLASDEVDYDDAEVAREPRP